MAIHRCFIYSFPGLATKWPFLKCLLLLVFYSYPLFFYLSFIDLWGQFIICTVSCSDDSVVINVDNAFHLTATSLWMFFWCLYSHRDLYLVCSQICCLFVSDFWKAVYCLQGTFVSIFSHSLGYTDIISTLKIRKRKVREGQWLIWGLTTTLGKTQRKNQIVKVSGTVRGLPLPATLMIWPIPASAPLKHPKRSPAGLLLLQSCGDSQLPPHCGSPTALFPILKLACSDTDARMTCAGISGAQGSWARSEDESTGGLQQQRSERFYL
jgi:hypothetical protein